MTRFLVYRHGSNAANQSMMPVSAVGIVEAESPEAAKKIAGEEFTCYNNQYFSVVAEADLSEEDCEEWNEIGSRDAELRATGGSSIIINA